ncbi:MAG: ubiquitin-like domain-containing protein [Firmicutes bacterium]|nr:ubiquitin-like domain-containing protein [Bacillota bacterium]
MGLDPARTGRKAGVRMDGTSDAVVFLLAATLLVVLSLHLARRDVVLVVEGERLAVRTLSANVAGVLSEAGLELEEGDQLSYLPTERLRNGMVIEIARSFPVTFLLDGKEVVVRTAAATVSDVLERAGLQLGELDRAEPAPQEVLQPGDIIRLTRISRQLVTQQTKIAYREIRRGSAALDRGVSRVLQPGAKGLRDDTVEVTHEDGQQVAVRLVRSRLVRPKRDQIVEYGENTTLSRGGRTMPFSRVIQVVATAYCPGTPGSGCPLNDAGHSQCTGRYNDGFTSTGRAAVAGRGLQDDPRLIAVDPRVIPLGSRLYIEGLGFALAVDTGGAIVGNRIDILFDRHEAARNFGRRSLRAYLLP